MTVTLRSKDYQAAANGVGTPLSATSKIGDLAVIVYSAQLANTTRPSPVPSGWTGEYQGSLDNKRGGYFATKFVESPNDTQNVPWFDADTAWGARQNAVLLVFSGAVSATATGWVPTQPSAPDTQTFIAGQTHASSTESLWKWDYAPGSTVINSGTDFVSKDVSWSALRIEEVPSGTTAPVWASGQGKPPEYWLSFTVKATPEVVREPVVFELSYISNGEEQGVAKAGIMPYGASSVENLLKIPDFVVAHRGGSDSWSEHTQQAYTNAVAYGCHALEISCGRSADGVWFGAHDKSLERIGGPATPVSQMDWADIQSAMKDTGFMPARLDWLLETYGNSHVIVFDPKFEVSRSAEYLPILAPYQDRVILKSAGDGTWAFKAWHAAGFKTWAYGYAKWKTDGTTHWQNFINDDSKDILSFEYKAPADLWTEVKATGKPVTSHIPSNADEIAQGKTNGAVGTITSSPTSVLTLKV